MASSPAAPNAENLTPLGNARRLVRRFGTRIRFVKETREWLCWNKRCWEVDTNLTRMRRLMEKIIQDLHNEAADPHSGKTADDRKSQSRWAFKSEDRKVILESIALASALRLSDGTALELSTADLDPHLELITCANGAVNLATGQLLPHDPTYLATFCAPSNFIPKDERAGRDCPVWKATVEDVACGDPELVNFIQEAAGRALAGVVSPPAMFILHGDGGAMKSTLVDEIQRRVGRYGYRLPMAALTVGGRSNGPRPELAEARGRRVLCASETSNTAVLDDDLVKQLLSGEEVNYRGLYSKGIPFRPQASILVTVNNLPKVRDKSRGIWRRLYVIPCRAWVSEKEEDIKQGAKRASPDHVVQERFAKEADAIFSWMVDGAMRVLRRQALPRCRAVEEASAAYRAEQDHIQAWVDDRCIVDASSKFPGGHLYKDYLQWCGEYGTDPENATVFGNTLAQKGFGRDRRGGTVYRHGLRLQASENQKRAREEMQEEIAEMKLIREDHKRIQQERVAAVERERDELRAQMSEFTARMAVLEAEAEQAKQRWADQPVAFAA